MRDANILFRFDNRIDALLDFCHWQRGKSESRATTLNRWCNLVDVVAYDAKADVLRILLDHSAKGCLGCLCHHICFIQNDEFEAFRKEGPRLGKLLDLFTNNIYSTIVRSIKLRVCQIRFRFAMRSCNILQESVSCNQHRRFAWLQQE